MLLGGPETLPSEPRAHLSSRLSKAAEAARRGAAGVLFLHTAEQEKRWPWTRQVEHRDEGTTAWLEEDGSAQGAISGIPVATLGPTGSERLFAGSRTTEKAALAAARTRVGRALDLGLVAELESRGELRRLESANVVARLPGSDPRLRDEHVVFSAHLDHEGLGRGKDGDRIYNGAYDNATGAAVLLEAARSLAASRRPRRSIVFLLVTAEEKGLLGSDYFAAHPTVPGVVANVNVDMPLFLFPVADLVAFGADNSTLEDVAREAAARAGLSLSPDPMPEESLFVRSDQYSFVRRGVPSVFLMPGFRSREPGTDGGAKWREFLSRYYHTPKDDLALPMDLDSAARFIRVNAEIGWAVAQADAPPAWKPGSIFKPTP
jgi:Zn-dependent M28 family amino/carboxypeptidase